jgi:parallel beta-helix repeat protein
MRIRSFIVSSLALSFSLGISIIPVPHMGLEHFQQVQAQAATTLYVDAAKGNSAGPGNAQAPFKTITAALQAAVPGTVIQVQPGKYDEANGEVFPLVIPSGVTLQGNVDNRGKDTLIQGGGKFLSPTVAGQIVGIVPQKGTTIQGLTISNPQKRGYGIWVEGTDPTIHRNTFTGSGNDGIMETGAASGKITNNIFYKNPSDGITLLRTASPLIEGNVFEDTGFAINIDEKSSPLVKDNVIINNADGIVILGKATPTLRGNHFERNRRSAIAIVGEAQPNLGTASERGGNYFHKNLKSDINNATRPQISIGAMGNEHTAKPKYLGNVQGDNAPVAKVRSTPTLPSASSVVVPSPAKSTATASPSSPSQKTLPPAPPSQIPIVPPQTSSPPPLPPVIPKPLPPGNSQTPAAKPLPPEPVATPPSRQSELSTGTFPPPAPANKPLPPQFGNTQVRPSPPQPTVQTIQPTILKPLPPEPVATPPSRQSELTKGTFPPPLAPANKPLPPQFENTQVRPSPPQPTVQTTINKPSKPEVAPVQQSSLGTRKYRVLITDASPDLRKLKQIVKNPFHREYEGRTVLQVGVFSSESSAKQVIRQLNAQGFKAIVTRA